MSLCSNFALRFLIFDVCVCVLLQFQFLPSFQNVTAPALMAKVEHRLACSAGSACHATEDGQDMHASYVLQAMGVPQVEKVILYKVLVSSTRWVCPR